MSNLAALAVFQQKHALTLAAAASPAPGGMKEDMWQAGLKALMSHGEHEKLLKPSIVTFIDFRITRNEPRLWTVNLDGLTVLFHTWVAHGSNSGGSRATSFGDGQRKTSLGSYVTLSRYKSSLGHVTSPEPAAKVIGLDPGINGRAYTRGVVFHAATYVNPHSVGNSWGCFSTPVSINRHLIQVIAGGTFAFAYAG